VKEAIARKYGASCRIKESEVLELRATYSPPSSPTSMFLFNLPCLFTCFIHLFTIVFSTKDISNQKKFSLWQMKNETNSAIN